LHNLSAVQLRDAFVEGKLSATEIVEFFLQRIDRYDQILGSFISVFESRARAQAKELDVKRARGEPLGALAAIPILLKDNIYVKGEITTCGSNELSPYVSPYDATVTSLIEAADGIIIGKGNMDELAMGTTTETSAFRVCSNPWDLKASPGGSSGGCAAAVAAGLVPLALGTDTGGSVRQPASFCGVIGFKPTYGRISCYGVVPMASSLDHIGIMATSTIDVAVLMNVLGRICPKDETSLPTPETLIDLNLPKRLDGVVIGVPRQFIAEIGIENEEAFNKALKVLTDLGATLVDVDLTSLKSAPTAYKVMSCTEALIDLTNCEATRKLLIVKHKPNGEASSIVGVERFGSEVESRLKYGATILDAPDSNSLTAQVAEVGFSIINDYLDAFTLCSLIATPTTKTPALDRGLDRDSNARLFDDVFTIGANIARLPAISLPCGFSKNGRPLGLHLTGPTFADANVIAAAHAYEAARGEYCHPEWLRS